MSNKADKKKRVRRGLKRAALVFLLAVIGLFGLNCGWDYIRGNRFLSFASDSWLLGANIAFSCLSPVVAFMSAFRKKQIKNKNK